jgi:hypothetical protein
MSKSTDPIDVYPSELSLSEARALYFQLNGFAVDGGYGAAWVTVKLGLLPFSFPNSAARVRAVRYHDLHHIVTGYQTTLKGEAEIAAFELASGCTGFPAALHLNLGALALGLTVAPLRSLRAYARGRRASNLYRTELDAALLESKVRTVRGQLGLSDTTPVQLPDLLRFVPLSVLAVLVALATLIPAVPVVLLAWPWLELAQRRARASHGSR